MKKGAWYRIYHEWVNPHDQDDVRDLDQGISALCDYCAPHFGLLGSVGDPREWASYWEPMGGDWSTCLVCKRLVTGDSRNDSPLFHESDTG